MLRPIPRPPCVCGPAGLLAGDVSGFGRASSAQATQSPQSDGGGVFFSFYFHNFHLSAGRPALCLVFDFVDDRRGLFPRPDIATDLVDYRSGRVQRPDLATSHGDYRSGRFPCPDFAPALVDYRRGRVPRRDFAPGHNYDHTLSGADYLHLLPVGDRIVSRFFNCNFHSFLSAGRPALYFSFF